MMNSWENININERVRLYTNGFKALTKTVPKAQVLSTVDNSDIVNDTIYVLSVSDHLLSNYKPHKPEYWKGQNDWSVFKSNYSNKYFSLLWGDNTKKCDDLPFLCKVRLIEQPGTRVLMRFNYNRHWGFVDTVRKIRNYDNFKNKKSIIHWRGSTTGWEKEPQRHIAVSKYYNNNVCDIAYQYVCQGFKLENPDYCKRKKTTPQEMLKNKYVLSIDGNDKASDINWKLASDSLVFMSQPKYESWLMETKLEPWVHYVPVEKDYSDLIEKYHWAEKNQDKCVQIIKNANLFMDSNFGDMKKEKEIEHLVLKYYLDNLNIKLE